MPQTTQQTNDFDLQAWLSDIAADNSLSEEEVKSLGKILGADKVQSKLRDQVLMRRDYTRKTQELAADRRQLEQDVESVLAERADLAKWKAGVDDQLKKAYGDLDSERLTTAQFRARIQTIADQTGLKPEDLLQGLPTATAATSTAVVSAGTGNGASANNGGNGVPNFDATKFVSTDDFSRFARTSPLLQAELYDLATEYNELFGKPFKMEYTDAQGNRHTGMRALVMKTAENNAKNPRQQTSVRQMFDKEFNTAARRDEILRESIRTEERSKLDAEYKTKLSEQMIAGGTPGRTTPLPDRPKSVLFDDKRDQRTPAEREAAARSGNGDNGNRETVTPPPVDTAAHREERWQKAARGYIDRRAQGVPLGQEAPAKSGL